MGKLDLGVGIFQLELGKFNLTTTHFISTHNTLHQPMTHTGTAVSQAHYHSAKFLWNMVLQTELKKSYQSYVN